LMKDIGLAPIVWFTKLWRKKILSFILTSLRNTNHTSWSGNCIVLWENLKEKNLEQK
jgi:hypothetical protein